MIYMYLYNICTCTSTGEEACAGLSLMFSAEVINFDKWAQRFELSSKSC